MSTNAIPPLEKIYLLSKDFKIEVKNDKLLINNEEKSFKNENGIEIIKTPKEIEEIAFKLMREVYSDKLLSKQYENFVLLSGAGTSIGIGNGKTKGKSMKELWKVIETTKKIDLVVFCNTCNYDKKNENLESLLSYATKALEFIGNKISVEYAPSDKSKEKANDESKMTLLNKGIDKIKEVIKEECNLILPEENSPHQILVNRITKRKLKYPRAKIFTLNYDTLFEQAAIKEKCILIDGFSYSLPREFNGRNFDFDIVIRENSRIKDEENFVPKVFHLYKLHGSLGWKKQNEKIIQTGIPDDELMIYPRDSKYEQSYEQPFFEMMSRLQQELRKSDILLVTIGFSFNDKHINTVIEEALSQNHGMQLLIVNPDIKSDKLNWYMEKSILDSRIMLISEKFEDFAFNYPENKSITQDERLRKIYE